MSRSGVPHKAQSFRISRKLAYHLHKKCDFPRSFRGVGTLKRRPILWVIDLWASKPTHVPRRYFELEKQRTLLLTETTTDFTFVEQQDDTPQRWLDEDLKIPLYFTCPNPRFHWRDRFSAPRCSLNILKRYLDKFLLVWILILFSIKHLIDKFRFNFCIFHNLPGRSFTFIFPSLLLGSMYPDAIFSLSGNEWLRRDHLIHVSLHNLFYRFRDSCIDV